MTMLPATLHEIELNNYYSKIALMMLAAGRKRPIHFKRANIERAMAFLANRTLEIVADPEGLTISLGQVSPDQRADVIYRRFDK